MSSQVTAILVVHDGATWLPQVVAAVASQSRTPNRTIAIDTGSVDGSTKLLSGARIKNISINRGEGFAIQKLPIAIASTLQYLAPIFTLFFAFICLNFNCPRANLTVD